jgi:hypothetical protein
MGVKHVVFTIIVLGSAIMHMLMDARQKRGHTLRGRIFVEDGYIATDQIPEVLGSM